MSVFNILKNNFYRVISKKSIIITTVIFVPLMIMASVYFTGKMEVKGTIAVVSNSNDLKVNTKYLKVEIMDEKPKMSELLLNKYDAIAVEREKGKFEIETIKGDKFKKMVKSILQSPNKSVQNLKGQEKRGIGTNILGFLIMLILIQALSLMSLYPEDRDLKTFKRVLIAPVSAGKYLLAQGIFDFIIIYIPVFVAIVITKEIFGFNIGFNYVDLSLLLVIITLIGIAFALFITSVIDDMDNSLMLGSAIITLSSIFAGSFHSFSESNKILDVISNILPQKSYLVLAQGIENGKNILSYKFELSYIIILILVLFIAGSLITRNNLKKGKY